MRISDWGSDVCSSELEFSDYAHADTSNYAENEGSKAGDDTITAEGGDDTIAGGSLAYGDEEAFAETDNRASQGGSAGNDVITSDGAEGSGNDIIAGGSAALAAPTDDEDDAFALEETWNQVGRDGDYAFGKAGSDTTHRPEARPVGEACGSTCNPRWPPSP